MEPIERDQDQVANESTGVEQPVASTVANNETATASAETLNGEQVEDVDAEKVSEESAVSSE